MIGSASEFARHLLNWYATAQRDLPWRARPGHTADPYHVLVSELMLQQTQVVTVIPYFLRFISRFGSVRDLALADEQEVLRHWQGLGYYSRARNLHACARKIVADHDSRVPASAQQLLALPGVGPYTAGAVASIAFGQPEPILDGNVARVLCRLDHFTSDPRLPASRQYLWKRAREILPRESAGDFNTGLMELGAMICTPRNPSCLLCPVAEHCEALAAGTQNQLPIRAKQRATPLHERWTLVVRRDDLMLIEQRPPTGRWASLWQFPTYSASSEKLTCGGVSELLGAAVEQVKPLGEVAHKLTHRRYHFAAYDIQLSPAADLPGKWVSLDRLSEFPMSRPQLIIAGLAAGVQA